MTTAEKILSGFIVILLIICVVLGVQKSNLDEEIGAAEFAVIEIREAKIAEYDNKIEKLNKIIAKLQTERKDVDAEQAETITITIRENNAIARLPYDEQFVYVANGLSSLDSIERRYFSGF